MKNFIDSEEYQYQKARKRAKEIRGFYYNLLSYCIIIPFIIGINLIYVPEFHFFWFSMVGWGTGVILHGMDVFGYNPFMRKNWEEKKLQQLLEKDRYKNTTGKPLSLDNPLSLEQQRLERVRKRIKAIAGFYKHAIAYVLINIFLISMKYFKLEPGENFIEFSTFSTPIFWGIGLGFHALGVFGTNIFLGQDWEEKKINEFMNKNQTTKWE